MKKMNLALIVVIVFAFLFISCEQGGNEELCTCFDGNIRPIDDKIIWDGNVDENTILCDHVILLVMDRNFSRPNIPPKKCFFRGIEIKYIEDFSFGYDLEDWRQILSIRLPINCKENVIRVVRQIEKIEGIRSVAPNMSMPGGI